MLKKKNDESKENTNDEKISEEQDLKTLSEVICNILIKEINTDSYEKE